MNFQVSLYPQYFLNLVQCLAQKITVFNPQTLDEQMKEGRNFGQLLGQALWVPAWWPFASLLRSQMAAVTTILVPGNIREAQSSPYIQLSGCLGLTR